MKQRYFLNIKLRRVPVSPESGQPNSGSFHQTCHKHCKTPFTRCNRLSNRFDNQLYRVNIQPVVKPVVKRVGEPVWQPCWTNSCSFNRFVKPVVQPGLTAGWISVYTIQPVVKPVVKRVWQPCWTNSCSFNRLSNSTPLTAVSAQYLGQLSLPSFTGMVNWVPTFTLNSNN